MHAAHIARAWAIKRKKLNPENGRLSSAEIMAIALLVGLLLSFAAFLILMGTHHEASIYALAVSFILLLLLAWKLWKLDNDFERVTKFVHNNAACARNLEPFLEESFQIAGEKQLSHLLVEVEKQQSIRTGKPNNMSLYVTILVSVCLAPFAQFLQKIAQPEEAVQLIAITVLIATFGCAALYVITHVRDTLFPSLPYGDDELQTLASDLRTLLLVSAKASIPAKGKHSKPDAAR